MNFENNSAYAERCDRQDKLSGYRQQFHHPVLKSGKPILYFAGHSLGLMPKTVRENIDQELNDWANLGVEGHFHARNPWLPYHEFLTPMQARLVGAKASEVVTMNTLTVNLHLMMVSFYRPTKKRFKILIENNTFPSDKYAVDSQARFHGFDASEAVIELSPNPGEITVSREKVIETIKSLGDELALVMLGNCNYLSGQRFDFESIVKASHAVGAQVGFNLAHGAGNLVLKLHDWDIDFAVWCSYKYLNSGPGSLAAAFIHERHHESDLPRLNGWWGHNKKTRFKMGPEFDPIKSAEAWQLSNPPIFQLAALKASLSLFDEVGMEKLRERGDRLTGFLEYLLQENLGDKTEVVTPQNDRGSMLCVRFKSNPKNLVQKFAEEGVIVDFREPDILRMTPAPLYNSFTDLYQFVEFLKEHTHD